MMPARSLSTMQIFFMLATTRKKISNLFKLRSKKFWSENFLLWTCWRLAENVGF